MKATKLLVLICAITFSLSFQAAAQESYKLVVRGGDNVGRQIKGLNQNFVNLIVDFKFGTKPAGAGLSPGEGSWMDRGMRTGEPTRLVYAIKRSKAENIAASLGNPRVHWAFWCYNTGKGYMKVTSDAQAGGPPPSRID